MVWLVSCFVVVVGVFWVLIKFSVFFLVIVRLFNCVMRFDFCLLIFGNFLILVSFRIFCFCVSRVMKLVSRVVFCLRMVVMFDIRFDVCC